MSTVINTNIAATRTHNVYSRNNDYMNAAMTKVATGMKINSAKDGASTWAISEKMRERIRANDQANQNVQNDTALVKTAQGGISNTIDILKTLKERAINAADDTNQDSDRKRIVVEVKELLNQIDDNTAKVKFNGRALIDGSLAAADSSGGSGSSTPVNKVTAVTGTFTESSSGTASNTGESIVLRYMELNGTAVAGNSFDGTSTLDVSVNGTPLELTGMTGSKTLGELITAINTASDDVEAQYVASGATLTDPEGNTVKAADGTTDYTTTAAGLYFVSKGGGSAAVTFTPSGSTTFSLSPADVSGLYDGTVTTYTKSTVADNAAVSDETVAGELEVAVTSPTHGQTLDLSTVSTLYSDNAGTPFTSGAAVLTYDDGTSTGTSGTAGWYNKTGADFDIYTKDDADDSKTSGLTFYVGGEKDFGLNFNIESMKVSNLFGMSISKVAEQFSTSTKAQGVIDTIDTALNKALDEQTKLGAWENRLGYTSDNLTTMNENLEAADSVMRDSDIAKEMTQYMKYAVLSQASQYMLAQAGQNAFQVLNLLQQ